ncbi:MAG: nuclear transport factor 2 family protein [Longimicrobiales bacterium]
MAALVLTACGGSETPEPDAVVAAERAFSATSVAEGTRAAFLQWFAPDAVSFGPGPLRGTDHIADWPPEGPTLEWAPELAEISADGRMGYTLGPYRQSLPDGGTAWGHYHSVWRQTDAGEWRVALDIGTPHGPVPWPPGSVATPAPTSAAASRAGHDGLLERDRAFAAGYASDGREAAMRGFVAERARISRTGTPPWPGRAAALEALGETDEALTWTPAGAGVADSGDLGYTWGSGTLATGPMSYARFWRRQPGGEWQVVVEVVASHPPPPPSGG